MSIFFIPSLSCHSAEPKTAASSNPEVRSSDPTYSLACKFGMSVFMVKFMGG